MKPNLFAMQVLAVLAFIPALIILEFNHKRTAVPQNKETVKIARVITGSATKTRSHVTQVQGLPCGIVFLYY